MSARPDPPLSWPVRQYLAAFQQYLDAGGERAELDNEPAALKARELMREHLDRRRRACSQRSSRSAA